MGIILSNYIDVNDIQNLSAYLTTIDSNVNKYDYFISQFFLGILFILFVFCWGQALPASPLLVSLCLPRDYKSASLVRSLWQPIR